MGPGQIHVRGTLDEAGCPSAGISGTTATAGCSPHGYIEAVAYALYVLAVLYVTAAIARVAMIGKPRKPVTRGDASASVVYCATATTHIGDRDNAPWLATASGPYLGNTAGRSAKHGALY
jgi:hypothetical protein